MPRSSRDTRREQQRFALVAAAALLERVGTPVHPRDLVDLPAILHRFPSGRTAEWEFERGDERMMERPALTIMCGGVLVELAMAEREAGFAATFAQWARPGIESGRLVSLFEDWLPPFPRRPALLQLAPPHAAGVAGVRRFHALARLSGLADIDASSSSLRRRRGEGDRRAAVVEESRASDFGSEPHTTAAFPLHHRLRRRSPSPSLRDREDEVAPMGLAGACRH